MKDSGVEWIGEIPFNWSWRKFRFLFRESGEKIEDDVFGPMLSVSGYRGIEVKEYDDENQKRSDEDLVGYRIVRDGQLVVNTMWLNYAGLGVSNHEGHVSPAYRAYFINDAINRRYCHHLLRSDLYVKGYTRLLTGIRPNSLQMSREDLMDFPVLLPPIEEQSAIASFIDHETGKMDQLVKEAESAINLLQERRSALISAAVTGQIDVRDFVPSKAA
jgi:type I restriction enzyme S subunit